MEIIKPWGAISVVESINGVNHWSLAIVRLAKLNESHKTVLELRCRPFPTFLHIHHWYKVYIFLLNVLLIVLELFLY